MKVTIPSLLLVCLGLFQISFPARGDDIFTFAGYTFDQRNTPDRGARLGESNNLGGAIFSSGFASTTTLAPINFPQGGTGFNTNLSLAQLSGMKAGLYAVNLPNGNDGATNRHGIEVWWSNNRGIQNLPGADFVVYESASTISAVEGVMVRARTNQLSDIWTDWFYFASTNFQIASGVEGVHSYGFDLSEMAVAENTVVDRIQLANLIQADRMAGAGTDVNGTLVGQGKVVFGSTNNVMPDAGPYDSDRLFAGSQLDPDPLYLASLQAACEWVSPILGIQRSGTNILLTWPAPSCFTPQITTELLQTNTSWGALGGTIFLTNGMHALTINGGSSNRFYRLIKP